MEEKTIQTLASVFRNFNFAMANDIN